MPEREEDTLVLSHICILKHVEKGTHIAVFRMLCKDGEETRHP